MMRDAVSGHAARLEGTGVGSLLEGALLLSVSPQPTLA